MAIASVLLGLFYLLWVFSGSYRLYDDEMYLYYMIFISAILFVVGSILIGIGFVGFSKLYNSIYGYVPMIFGIVSSVLFLLFMFLSLEYRYSSGYYPYYDGYSYHYLNVLWLYIGHILIGVFAILTGVGLLVVRKKTGYRGPCIASGTIFIVAGSMLIGFLGFIGAAWFLLASAGFVAMVVFMKAKLVPPPEPQPYGYPGYPEQQYPQQQYPPQEQYPPQQQYGPPPPGY